MQKKKKEKKSVNNKYGIFSKPTGRYDICSCFNHKLWILFVSPYKLVFVIRLPNVYVVGGPWKKGWEPLH